MSSYIREFLKLESSSAILLFIFSVLGLILANSPLSDLYQSFLKIPVSIQFSELIIDKPLILWINDGLMAGFFFLIGLELKREILEGELSKPSQVVLPFIAAVGGMVVPAAIYSILNWGDEVSIKGWAIPTATDIAFALGILSVFGSRVPLSLKIFLTTLAIFDDIGAIVVIAFFYTSKLSLISLIAAAVLIMILFIMNRKGVKNVASFIFVGSILWVAVLKSGIHATLAGVVLAFFIPMYDDDEKRENSPLLRLEKDFHGTVAYIILPLFAFVNAGLSFDGILLSSLFEPVPLGIAAGLFIGKQLGVFSFVAVAVKTGLCKLPRDISLLDVYGISAICGVGFTMSLFIGSLAFEQGGPDYYSDDKLGILFGSIISAIAGYIILSFSLKK